MRYSMHSCIFGEATGQLAELAIKHNYFNTALWLHNYKVSYVELPTIDGLVRPNPSW